MSSLQELLFTAGFILVRVGPNDVHTVRKELQQIEAVRIAHPLLGPDDLICYVEANPPQQFRRTINRGIRKLMDAGLIEHTETLMIATDMDARGYGGKEDEPTAAAAWLFCDVSVSDPQEVIKELKQKELVVDAHPVLGRYDFIAYIQARSMDELMRVINEDIRQVKGIKNTDTRLVWTAVAKSSPSRERDKQKRISMPTG
jgi:DNA-binding Lrp family transcriptional regulator